MPISEEEVAQASADMTAAHEAYKAALKPYEEVRVQAFDASPRLTVEELPAEVEKGDRV